MGEIRLKNITKSFGDNTVVNNIDLEVHDREFMVLVGPSGCGKSTLLRLITGLEEATSGDILIDNKRVNDLSPKERDIAIVFQNYALYPHMTAYANLAFGLKIKKVPKKEIDDRVRKAAHILEIEDLLDRKPSAMSGGQRQRVAIGRAIVREPKVFLFDEPLSNLDAKLRGQMRIEIAKLHQRLQTTIIYVTHDQAEAMTLGERIAVMDKGVIQQVDTPHALYTHPGNTMVAGFIGTPPMNFIRGTFVKDRDDWIFEASDLTFKVKLEFSPGPETRNTVMLGIRPEDVHLKKRDLNVIPLNTRINFVENMGHEFFAYSQIQSRAFISRLQINPEGLEGQDTQLYLDVGKMHFFHAGTGQLLGSHAS